MTMNHEQRENSEVRALSGRVDELDDFMGLIRRSEWVWPAVTQRLPAWPVVDTLPTADDLQGYRTLTLRGTPDTAYICLRDTLGVWSWIELATAGAAAAINVLLEQVLVGTRNSLNFRAGDHIDLTVTDDGVNGRVNVEIDVDDTAFASESAFATHATQHERGGTDEVTDIAYTPAVSGDWSPVPNDVAEALDQLAARVAALEP